MNPNYPYSLYLAGPLFGVAERAHNLRLAKALEALGYRCILPQVVAAKHIGPEGVDIDAIETGCLNTAIHHAVVVVACADGPDADSRTGVEFGAAMVSHGRAVVYCTDFRTHVADGNEVVLNRMLRVRGAPFVYYPCYCSEEKEFEAFYKELALQLHEEVEKFS